MPGRRVSKRVSRRGGRRVSRKGGRRLRKGGRRTLRSRRSLRKGGRRTNRMRGGSSNDLVLFKAQRHIDTYRNQEGNQEDPASNEEILDYAKMTYTGGADGSPQKKLNRKIINKVATLLGLPQPH
jgi:hypothetical protein